MKRPYLFLFVFSVFSLQEAFSATYPLHAFEDYGSTRMKKMELIGVVTSKGHEVAGKTRLKMLDYDTREMILSAKLYEDVGVRIGDEIFIIQKDPDHVRYKNGLIVGKAEIVSVFQTEFQGWMVKARGNLSMVKKGHFIARLDFGTQRQLALEYSRKGDRYFTLKDYANAYYWYKQSLDLDQERPETFIKLSKLMSIQGMDRKAFVYIHQAWELNAKITDPNAYLDLPGMYLHAAMDEIERRIAAGDVSGDYDAYRLKNYLHLLDEVREFQTQVIWIKPYLSPDVLRLMEKKGIPHPEFQYRFASLLESIYGILKETGRSRKYSEILEWLARSERTILLTELHLPYRENQFEDPQKSWDEAYFKAALYHYELAHELNSLDTRAAYRIILLAEEKIAANAPQKQREIYLKYIEHYSREYFRVPDESDRVRRVRQIVSRRIQD